MSARLMLWLQFCGAVVLTAFCFRLAWVTSDVAVVLLGACSVVWAFSRLIWLRGLNRRERADLPELEADSVVLHRNVMATRASGAAMILLAASLLIPALDSDLFGRLIAAFFGPFLLVHGWKTIVKDRIALTITGEGIGFGSGDKDFVPWQRLAFVDIQGTARRKYIRVRVSESEIAQNPRTPDFLVPELELNVPADSVVMTVGRLRGR